MNKITTGKQYDDSKSKNEIVVTPAGNLDVAFGDIHDRAQTELLVRETAQEGAAPPPEDKGSSRVGGGGQSATALWAKGSFFLVAFATVGAVIGILANKLAWYLVPISVVGAIIVLYLLATILVPHGPLTEKGLLSVLQAYVRLAFTISPDGKGKSIPAAAKNAHGKQAE